MSSVIIQNRVIESIAPHSCADKLEIAVVGGWQVVVRKGTFVVGDKVTYIPPDCVIPKDLAEKWGVGNYLSNGRVRSATLRGEISHGFIVPAVNDSDENLADMLGITKYEPPAMFTMADAVPSHPAFFKFTDIENLRHFNSVLRDGEPIIVTEKIHGTNSRIGLINENGEWIRATGTKTLQRENSPTSLYNIPWNVPEVVQLLENLKPLAKNSIIVFGEIFGRKVQGKMDYGIKNADYLAFDVMIDGKYVDAIDFYSNPIFAPVKKVPVLDRGTYDFERMKKLAFGNTVIPNGNHIREGIVVRPERERIHPKTGRVILKFVNDDYLAGDYDSASE